MTSCAWPQSARVRTRVIRGRPTRRPISTCGDSLTAKPTSIGTKARSTPLLLVDAAPAVRADLRLAAGSNQMLRGLILYAQRVGHESSLRNGRHHTAGGRIIDRSSTDKS